MSEYQKLQKPNFFNECDCILSFVSSGGYSAKFVGCYLPGTGQPAKRENMAAGFPAPEMFSEENYYFELKESPLLGDLKERLIINWGRSTLAWYQRATNEKEVLAIQDKQKFLFSGFENVVLTYQELKEIVSDPTLYEDWITALSSVYAIYLITDRTDGKHYVGSAYGKDGLLGRWKHYIETKHGDNKQMKEIICNQPERYQNFQFSILQILPKTLTDDEVIQIESLYKRKLLSKEFGLNDN